MAIRRTPLPYVRPLKMTRGASTLFKKPRYKTERRIQMGQPTKRPLRFQVRTVLRREELKFPDPFWFVLHRRGPNRSWVGENPLEARAISRNLIRGTLPERIVYKYLVEFMHFSPGIDFTFQSSLQGGRVDTGGIVADFLFPYLMIVIQVQGPTHDQFRRMRKDDEQWMALEEMGYQVMEIWEDDIYDEYRLEEWMRKAFNWYHSGDAGTKNEIDLVPSSDGFSLAPIEAGIRALGDVIYAI